ncbi:MAG: DEAD/DEAH box helicase, partial [Pseudomonadota bacterium]
DVPSHSEDYVHRIGRTGRAGRDGKAVMICASADEKNLDAIEKLIDREIPRAEIDVPRAEKPKRERRAKKDDAPEAVEAPEAANEQPPKKRERGARGRRSEGGDLGGNKVVGMGDHMPSFIAKSFDERKAS